MRNMVTKRRLGHFHDDEISDKTIEVEPMPYDDIFGDYRIFNGLPLEIVDTFLGRFREIMVDLKQAHEDYKDYYESHPNY